VYGIHELNGWHTCYFVHLSSQPRPDDNPAFSLLSRCSLEDGGPDALVGDALFEHLDGLLRGHFVFSGLSMRFKSQVYAQFVREVCHGLYLGACICLQSRGPFRVSLSSNFLFRHQVTAPTCAVFENTPLPDTFYVVAQGSGRLCIRDGEEGDPVRVVHAGDTVNDVALIHPITVRGNTNLKKTQNS
jgi:hypothetical protein